MNRQKLT